MSNTNAVKNPKNGVISCWVCTFVMLAVDLVRYFLLLIKGNTANIIFHGLLIIWVVLSVIETVKYFRNRDKY